MGDLIDPRDLKHHEPECVWTEFPHRKACTCPRTVARYYLDRGLRTKPYPERNEGLGAEDRLLELFRAQGIRARLTRELFARFPAPGLANATIGDLLYLLPNGQERSAEVKLITSQARESGMVSMSDYEFDQSMAEWLVAVDPTVPLIHTRWLSDARRASDVVRLGGVVLVPYADYPVP